MAEIVEIEETKVISDSTETAIKVVYYLAGFIETMLLFRLIFRAFGASASSPFVGLIYAISRPMVAPFTGIFPSSVSGDSVVEPSVLVAMLVYALLAKGIEELIKIIMQRGE